MTTSLFRAGTYFISSDITAEIHGAHPQAGLRRAMYNPLLACYQAGDGRWFWLLGLQAERHWPNVLRAIGRTELLTDERFTSFGQLLHNSAEVIALLDEAFAARTLDEWIPIFDREDVWWDPIQSLAGLLDDPLFAASGAAPSGHRLGQTHSCGARGLPDDRARRDDGRTGRGPAHRGDPSRARLRLGQGSSGLKDDNVIP